MAMGNRRGKAVGMEERICQKGNEAREWVKIEEGNADAVELRRGKVEDQNAIKEF
jgi:hypothetical protein